MTSSRGHPASADELTEALDATQAAVVLSTHDRQLLRDAGDWPQLHLSPATEDEPPACGLYR